MYKSGLVELINLFKTILVILDQFLNKNTKIPKKYSWESNLAIFGLDFFQKVVNFLPKFFGLFESILVQIWSKNG